MAPYSACHAAMSNRTSHGLSGTARANMLAEKLRQAITL
jgi:hypothetical protein